ncbi:MAG: metallophosphoesterase [Chloroflexi bacterium]|nr:metallophosphoesterase [Chloroflexota bacterium]
MASSSHKRVAWLTDIHLEFLEAGMAAFLDRLAASEPDIVLIGGDTGTARDVIPFLYMLEKSLRRPIYFVLGNHDFYRGSIRQVRAAVQELSQASRWLRWLPAQGVVRISDTTGLLGHGSWADGRLGNGRRSLVELNDYYYIQELMGLSREERFERLATLGDEAAAHFRRWLPEACSRFRDILLLTHVPPFREASRHKGQISDDESLPHFSCQAVGDVLLDVMTRHPENRLTVLCGHTHSPGEVSILPNLHVKTGGAEYGRPDLQEILLID